MLCEYTSTCMVKSKERCSEPLDCQLRHFQLLEEQWKREDEQMRKKPKLFSFHDYEQTSIFYDDLHFGAEPMSDGVNK